MDVPRQNVRKSRRWIYAGVALAVVLLGTVALARLEPAAPTVERATIWTDTVQRGPMVREVRGPGTLVPERTRWISAVTAGRVERSPVEPGSTVGPETVLLELSNPDVQLQALAAEQQLAAAEAELASLRSTLENQRLGQEAAVAAVRAESREAARKAETDAALVARELIPRVEAANSRESAQETAERLEIERQRLDVFSRSTRSQIAAQQAQIERLRETVEFQRRQREAMQVRAGAAGVLQELALEVGQWATPGATLAKVIEPGRLKAVLRIPETQARDVAVGQPAAIDTRNGVVQGRVTRIDPAVENGTVTVDVALTGPLPRGARPDLSVDGTIQIERLDDVLFVGRPAYGQPESTVGLFRIAPDGESAVRVPVQLGRSSVNTVEIRGGLQPGDVVILSDMSQWDSADRVRLR